MELNEIRDHLDRVDRTLILVLAERMNLITKVAEYKKENNIERYQPKREEKVINSKRKLAEQENINPDLVEELFKNIIKDSHRIEKNIMGE